MDSLRADFESGDEYSDMTLACGERTWKVHSIVICPQSKRIDEEYRKLKTAGEKIKITFEDVSPETALGVIQYCYSGRYPKVPGSMNLPAVVCHIYYWSFAIEWEMKELSHIAQQQFEEAAAREIGTAEFAKFLRGVLHDHPLPRESCLKIIENHTEEVFGGSPDYDELCEVIKADTKFLFELTVRMARSQKQRAQTGSNKRANAGEETGGANKRQKPAGGESVKGTVDAQVASGKLLDQVAALRPEDVQCCSKGPPRDSRQELPSPQTSSARDLLRANGYVNFHSPDCRDHFDACIKLQDKFTHQCRNRHEGKGTEHTGATWHAFFRSGVSMSLSTERQFWGLFERLQKTLNDDKLK